MMRIRLFFLLGLLLFAGCLFHDDKKDGDDEIKTGKVTSSGNTGVQWVSLDLYDQVRGYVTGSSTDSNGRYRFNLEDIEDGYYIIKPYKAYYTFKPMNNVVEVKNHTLLKTVDFTAIPSETGYLSRHVQGWIVDENNKGIENLIVTLESVDNIAYAVTNKRGRYSFSDLREGTYTLTPQSQDYTYTPSSKNFVLDTTKFEMSSIQAVKVQ